MSVKIIKLIILINDLSFFCSHRLPIAEAAKDKAIEVIIGYGELGTANPSILEQKGFKLTFIPIKRGSINFLKDLNQCYIFGVFSRKKSLILALSILSPTYMEVQ